MMSLFAVLSDTYHSVMQMNRKYKFGPILPLGPPNPLGPTGPMIPLSPLSPFTPNGPV